MKKKTLVLLLAVVVVAAVAVSHVRPTSVGESDAELQFHHFRKLRADELGDRVRVGIVCVGSNYLERTQRPCVRHALV